VTESYGDGDGDDGGATLEGRQHEGHLDWPPRHEHAKAPIRRAAHDHRCHSHAAAGVLDVVGAGIVGVAVASGSTRSVSICNTG